MDTIHNFLASHPYAETTLRTYSIILRYLLAHCTNLARLTATELVHIIKQSGWGNSRQCVALAARNTWPGDLAMNTPHFQPASNGRLENLSVP